MSKALVAYANEQRRRDSLAAAVQPARTPSSWPASNTTPGWSVFRPCWTRSSLAVRPGPARRQPGQGHFQLDQSLQSPRGRLDAELKMPIPEIRNPKQLRKREFHELTDSMTTPNTEPNRGRQDAGSGQHDPPPPLVDLAWRGCLLVGLLVLPALGRKPQPVKYATKPRNAATWSSP